MFRFAMHPMIALAMVVAVSAVTANADTVTLRQGLNGYTDTVDLYIRSGTATSNYAAEERIDLWGNSVSGTTAGLPDTSNDFRQGLLRFDNLFADVPTGAIISSAQLTVNIDNSSESLHVFRVTTGWTAANASWNHFDSDGSGDNNADLPSEGGGLTVNVDTVSTPDYVGPDNSSGGTGTGALSIDVTSTVQAWYGGADNFGWVFMMEDLNRGGFSSSEYTTDSTLRPTLVITFTVIPEPTSLASVIGFGSMMLIRRRRNG
ncbi:DNRLRE domain-containing protein [Planctomycetales bacterium ZRK34]|nr:DNRLRE domain-containing protein [Planctomycetales bacterium ZRK34]